MDYSRRWYFEDFGTEIEIMKRENENIRIDIEEDKYSRAKSVLILESDVNGMEVLSIDLEGCYVCIRGENIIDLLKKEIRKLNKRNRK